jgi:DNA-binding PadR family transcriptional regulator
MQEELLRNWTTGQLVNWSTGQLVNQSIGSDLIDQLISSPVDQFHLVYQLLIYHGVTMPATDAYLPLSPAVFHILLALAEADSHGYAIMRDVEDRTGGLVRIGPGMLYGSIKWLADDRLIEEVPSKRRDGDDRRRSYRLTAAGRALLKAEAARLESAVALARTRRVLPKKA